VLLGLKSFEGINGFNSQKLLNDRRLHVHEGVLTEATLGLSEEVFSKLRSTVSIVYHNAAAVSHFTEYETLHEPNVHASENLGLFALGTRLHANFRASQQRRCNASRSRPENG
jgi:thioester reductase-like protein